MIRGREAELETVVRLLHEGARVVTVWGPPGIGKTRLAELVCRDARPPAIPVPLAGVAGVDGLVAAVAAATSDGAAEPDPARLAGRWLFLDNLEHLLDGDDGAAVLRTLGRWLARAPGLQVLATSRRLLRLADEHAVALGPLVEADGVAMFVDLVRRRRPDFAPGPDEARELAALVRALDGIPLALAIAAARWELLGTAGLLRRSGDLLPVLERPRAEEPRHATLRGAIAWSWDLLSSTDREALEAVARFEGPFDLAAAEALVGARALDALESLSDAALVQIPVPGTFALLGSVRAFARERTDPERAEALALAHAASCVSAGRVHRDDLEAAARVLVGRGDPRAEPVLVALGAAAPGRHLRLLNEAVARLGTAGVLRARGRALRLRGRPDEALRDFEAALARAPDVRARGHLLRELGVLHHGARRPAEARERYEQALACHREAGDAHGEAITVGNLGALDHDACSYEDAEVRYEAALAGLRAAGDRRTEATFLANQAVLRQEQGQLAAAEPAYRRALALQREAGDPRMEAITLGNLGFLLHELGRLEEARALHEEAARLFETLPDPVSEALCLARLGAARAVLRDEAGAEVAFDRAERVAAPLADPLAAGVVALTRAFLDLERGDLPAAERRMAGARGLAELSGDARVALRLLRARVPVQAEALVALEHGFVPPGGERQDLSRHASCRRMFQALVDAREQEPGRALTLEVLFEAGWPGERIAHDSVRNRVHVNLAKLRNLGLKAVLVRTDAGYHLDPGVPVLRG